MMLSTAATFRQHERAPALEPVVDVRCTVCDSAYHTVVASAAEIAAQQRYLRTFHRRRLKAPRADGALTEKAEFTQDYATNIVACSECDLLYRDPRPADEDIAAAYAAEEYGAARLEELFGSQLELFRPKARELTRHLAHGHQPLIVEVGSFVGGFLAAVREERWRGIGIDPGAEVGEFCKDKGLDVLAVTPAECDLSSAADCVAVWNTFDQLPRPQATVAAARRMLRPGGLLIVRVPNGAAFRRCMAALRRGSSLSRRCLTAAMAWNNLLAFPYLHGYSLPNLDLLLADYGFARFALAPDVLTRLADTETKWWARAEESLLKSMWRAAWRLSREPRAAEIAPWLDVYYRLSIDSAPLRSLA